MSSAVIHEEDDNESLNDETIETSVDIGIINENEKTHESRLILHSSTFYPCKLGGKPQWLDIKNLKNLHDCLLCSNCKLRLSFLFQIYAPLDQEKDEQVSFHRYLYIFICSNSNCSNKTIKIFRNQLGRNNDFYSNIAPPVANTVELLDYDGDYELIKIKIKNYLFDFYKNYFQQNLNKFCNICGFLSTKMCSKCKFIYYCCESHQKLDWSYYKHKINCEKYCNAQNLDDKIKLFIEYELDKDIQNENTIFPEYEILIEPEELDCDDCDEEKVDQKKIDEQLKLNEHLSKDLEDLPENEHDKDFELFKKRLSNEPKQIIRYDRNGKPLWSTNKSKLTTEDSIPKCNNCNSKRIFEFQVMPQLLTYLKLNEDLESNNTIDWASLYIYTCEKNCNSNDDKNMYIEEFIYKQDF